MATEMLPDQPAIRLGPSDAPMIFFDGAPAFTFYDGVVAITLVATQHRPLPGADPVTVHATVGYLRGNIQAAKILRAALDNVIFLAEGRRQNGNDAVN